MIQRTATVAIVSILAACALTNAETLNTTGIFVLHPNADKALALSGSAICESTTVHVNSSGTKAIDGSGSAVIEATQVDVLGGVNFSGTASCSGTLTTGMARASDPASALPAPSWDARDDLGTATFSGGTGIVGPGYYSGGINVSGGADVTLEPGIYILGGEGLRVSSSSVRGNGVTLYITGGAALTLSGGSTVDLRPSAVGPLATISVFQDRANTKKMTISGGSGLKITGAIYAPSAPITISGEGDITTGPFLGNFVVAESIEISGSGRIAIGMATVPLPSFGAYD